MGIFKMFQVNDINEIMIISGLLTMTWIIESPLLNFN